MIETLNEETFLLGCRLKLVLVVLLLIHLILIISVHVHVEGFKLVKVVIGVFLNIQRVSLSEKVHDPGAFKVAILVDQALVELP